jgi:hypothetical protein
MWLKVIVTGFLLIGQAMAGEIALSFDDAPLGKREYYSGLERTRILISKLDSIDVEQVVFYCGTDRSQWHDGLKRLRMYGEAGHLLGNHSHSHQRPHELGSEEYIRDIARAHDILKALPGFIRWYRFPFLDEGNTVGLRDSLRAALDSLDYVNGYTTVDNYDWYLDKLFQEAVETGRDIDYDKLRGLYVDLLWDAILFYDDIGQRVLGRSPKHILLLHENDLAALCVDTLVDHIRGHGWKIISPRDAYSDPVADIATETLFNNQGRIAAVAAAQGIRRQRLVHPAEDVDYLDSLIDASGVFR